MAKQFVYRLSERVAIKGSEENGKVIARSDSTTMQNQYHVRYKAADGRMCEGWWSQSALKPYTSRRRRAA